SHFSSAHPGMSPLAFATPCTSSSPSAAPPHPLHSLPTRRSSDLAAVGTHGERGANRLLGRGRAERDHDDLPCPGFFLASQRLFEDRKSTRLNSSHDQMSYAVFCL